MNSAVERSEWCESNSEGDLQNEQSYLSGGSFPESSSDALVSGRYYETRNEYKLVMFFLERSPTLNGHKFGYL